MWKFISFDNNFQNTVWKYFLIKPKQKEMGHLYLRMMVVIIHIPRNYPCDLVSSHPLNYLIFILIFSLLPNWLYINNCLIIIHILIITVITFRRLFQWSFFCLIVLNPMLWKRPIYHPLWLIFLHCSYKNLRNILATHWNQIQTIIGL